MASNKHTIEIAGQAVEVPAWASEEQLKELIAIDKGHLASLSALLQNNKAISNRQIRENKLLLNNLTSKIEKGNKQAQDASNDAEKSDRHIFKSLRDLLDVNKLQAARAKKAKEIDEKRIQKLNDNVQNLGSNLATSAKNLGQGIQKNDLKGIATAIGSVAGLGTAVGFGIGVLEGFAKNLSELTNTGVGLGTSLQDLRNNAASAGLDLASYGKIINGNSRAIRAMGTSTDSGAAAFSNLSSDLRRVAKDFGMFGLTNTEYNEILADEIDLRRKSGMNEAQITNSVSKGMNNLLLETTALANLTGQDRREMLRNRAALMDDTSVALARKQVEAMGGDIENVGTLATELSGIGDIGALLAKRVADAALSDTSVFTGTAGAQLSKMASLAGGEFEVAFRDLAETARTQVLTMDSASFGDMMREKVLELQRVSMPDTAKFEQLQVQSQFSNTVGESAKSLLEFMTALQIGERNLTTKTEATDKTADELKENQIMSVPASMEEAANKIKASALNTVLGFTLDVIGADLEDAGSSLVRGIDAIGDRFGEDKGIFEGIGIGGTALITGLAAATVAIKILTATMAAGVAMRAGKGLMGLLGLGGALAEGADAALGGDDKKDKKDKTSKKPKPATVKPRSRLGNLLNMGRKAGGFISDRFNLSNAKNVVTSPGVTSTVNTVAKKVPALTALYGAVDASQALLDDTLTKKEKSQEVGGAIGGAGGAIGGMMMGAAAGTALIPIPVVGTVVGGIIGGIMGQLGGDMAGSAVGSAVGDVAFADSVSDLDTDIADTTKEIEDLKARIKSSVDGQNEFWGNEEGGIRKSKEEIKKLEEHLAQLRDNSQSASVLEIAETNKEISRLQARIARSKNNEDEFWGGEINGRRETAEEIKKLQEHIATLTATAESNKPLTVTELETEIDTLKDSLTPPTVSPNEQSRTPAEIADINNRIEYAETQLQIAKEVQASKISDVLTESYATMTDAKAAAEKLGGDYRISKNEDNQYSVTATKKVAMTPEEIAENPQRAAFLENMKTVDLDPKVATALQQASDGDAKFSQLQLKILKEQAKTGDARAIDILAKYKNQSPEQITSAIQNSTVLNTHKKYLQAQEKFDSKLNSFKAEHGAPEVIGQKQDFNGDTVDVLGYTDTKLQAQYEQLSGRSERTESHLRRLEQNDRYKLARATELAKQMNINTENGKEIKFTATGNVPTSINGKAVDENLLTEREKRNINTVQEIFKNNMMDTAPPVSPIPTDTTSQVQPEGNKDKLANLTPGNVPSMTAEQADKMIALQVEQNRILKKQTTTIENTA